MTTTRREFYHAPNPLKYKLGEETTKKGRTYISPSGERMVSITTLLGLRKAASIAKWRAAVGEEEANKITRHAVTRGNAIHNIAERYINNEEKYLKGDEMPHVLQLWNALKPILDNRIGRIAMQETPLYSETFHVAGRVDLIAEFDNELSIIDFKTSKRAKTKSDIESYFMQACAYALMFEERTGSPVNELVILMVVDGSSEPIVFKEKRDDWEERLYEEIEYYFENFKK